jgi:hypothetical protein
MLVVAAAALVMMIIVITATTTPLSEQNFDYSLCMEEVIGTNRLQTRTPSSFYTTGCLQRMSKGMSGNSACRISCGLI